MFAGKKYAFTIFSNRSKQSIALVISESWVQCQTFTKVVL